MIRRGKEWGSDRGYGKGNAIKSQAPFILPPQSLSRPFSPFQLPQQPSRLRASLPLDWAILMAFYLFFLSHNLDCITQPLIDLQLLPHYLSNYKLPGPLGPLEISYQTIFLSWLSFLFSEYSMLLTNSTTTWSTNQPPASLIFTLTLSPLYLFSISIITSPFKIIPSLKAWYKCYLLSKAFNLLVICSSLCLTV